MIHEVDVGLSWWNGYTFALKNTLARDSLSTETNKRTVKSEEATVHLG